MTSSILSDLCDDMNRLTNSWEMDFESLLEKLDERVNKMTEEAELRWLKGELQGYCKAIENQAIRIRVGYAHIGIFARPAEVTKKSYLISCWQRRHAEREERGRKEAQNQISSLLRRRAGIEERGRKEAQNQISFTLRLSSGIEERAPKEAQNQRKSVGRMDDGFMKTFPPVISHQQNNFKPNQETNISGKDSGTGGKAQRWQWEGMESNSRKTDDRNILVMTAARGMEEVCPISSPFSLKNRGQKQGNGEDNVKKQTLILLTTGTVSRSPMGHETGRVDIYAGDKNLLNAGFRKEHGIHDIIAMQQISVPCDAANDSDVKFLVRMRPYGEGKDSWEHCTTQDGDVGLPEEQPLYISHILRGSSTFPASATWVLETPDKCTPSSTLEAVLEINMVTGDSMVPFNGSNATSRNTVAQLSIQVQGKRVARCSARSRKV